MKQVFVLLICFLTGSHSFAQQEKEIYLDPDTTVQVKSSKMNRMGDNLVVSIQLGVTKNISPTESIVLMPELSDSLGNFLQLPSLYINGRRQHIFYQREIQKHEKESKAVRRKNKTNQSVSYLNAVPFADWMENAELTLIKQDCGCSVPYQTDSAYLASMPKVPMEPLHPKTAFAVPHVESVKIREESGHAYLDFPLNRVELNPEYHNNMPELFKIMESIDLVKNDTNVVISSITIHGFASPEGPYKRNDKLASERASTVKEYVKSLYAFEDQLMHVASTPEDWDGFVQFLTDSTITHQKELLKIARNDAHPDKKERQMKNKYPKEFKYMLDHWFPKLRHSDYTIRYVVRPFTVEQAKQIFLTHPKNLSVDEMFRIAQTYEQGSPEYNKIFKTAVLYNPNNPTANLNAACIALKENDLTSAEIYLAKSDDCPEKSLAVGVLHMLKGEYTEAREKLQEAQAAGLSEATYNLELLDKLN